MEIVLPLETDYPEQAFRLDQPSEMKAGCAWHYYKTNRVLRRLFRRRVEMAFALMPRRQWERALDAGTGVGFVLPALSQVAREVVGVDLLPVQYYAQAMLDKRGIRNVHLNFADLLHLPFPPSTFDLIICLSVIEHIPGPTAAFAEMGRVLRDDGMLIIGYPLEHAVHGFFRYLTIKLPRRLRRGLKQRAMSERKGVSPHTSDYHDIERSFEGIFRVDARRDVRVAGVPFLRLLRLVK
jgi:SAM-dependent methyltransferase